jgi:hypothetical protein
VIGAQLKSKSLSIKVQIRIKGISEADYSIQNSHYQQLADNGSKLAYLPATMRLMTSARFSAHQNSEIS